MAEITFIGNIGKDAVLRKTKSGYEVTDIWVAENLGRSNIPGEESECEWRKLTLWRGYAQAMVRHLKAGRRIQVLNGYLGKTKYYVSNNNIVPYTPITVGMTGKIYFMDGKKDSELPPEAVVTDEETEVPPVVVNVDLPFEIDEP